MPTFYVVSAVLGAGLFIYLLVAMLAPEDFS